MGKQNPIRRRQARKIRDYSDRLLVRDEFKLKHRRHCEPKARQSIVWKRVAVSWIVSLALAMTELNRLQCIVP